MATIYRGVTIAPNFTSIHGTGAKLAKPRGWNLYLPRYGSLGWSPSMADARRTVDGLREECSPPVARAFARLDNGGEL